MTRRTHLRTLLIPFLSISRCLAFACRVDVRDYHPRLLTPHAAYSPTCLSWRSMPGLSTAGSQANAWPGIVSSHCLDGADTALALRNTYHNAAALTLCRRGGSPPFMRVPRDTSHDATGFARARAMRCSGGAVFSPCAPALTIPRSIKTLALARRAGGAFVHRPCCSAYIGTKPSLPYTV